MLPNCSAKYLIAKSPSSRLNLLSLIALVTPKRSRNTIITEGLFQKKLHEPPIGAEDVLSLLRIVSQHTKGAVHEYFLKYGEAGCYAKGAQSASDLGVFE